jgi:hypothetical protein
VRRRSRALVRTRDSLLAQIDRECADALFTDGFDGF